MAFIQLIEVVTDRVDEIEALVAEWRDQTEGRRRARRGTLTADRDRPGTYLQIVEFDSYEDALVNSDLPETSAFASKLAKLCDQPPTFRNLDVRTVEELDATRAPVTRKVADCRRFPSESGCTLTIAGEEEEVMTAAIAHAASVHHHVDDAELRSWLRANLQDEPATSG